MLESVSFDLLKTKKLECKPVRFMLNYSGFILFAALGQRDGQTIKIRIWR